MDDAFFEGFVGLFLAVLGGFGVFRGIRNGYVRLPRHSPFGGYHQVNREEAPTVFWWWITTSMFVSVCGLLLMMGLISF